jgi:outer membrane protein
MIKYVGACIFSCCLLVSKGQTLKLSLQDIIRQAQTGSSSFKVAQTQKKVSNYEFLTYKSDLNPQVSVYGTLLNYDKEYTPITQPDGSVLYLPVQQNTNSIGLSLSQVLPFSGGTISLNTQLSQYYDLHYHYNQYNGTPFFLQFSQPLFGFNEVKWKKRIEPIKLEEARLTYTQDLESIGQKASQLFFDALDAQVTIDVASANLANDSVNYILEKKRVDLGTTTEDKLLQLELSSLRSKQALEKARYDYTAAKQVLKTYIGYKDTNNFELIPPDKIPPLSISLDTALEYARRHRPEYISFERKRKEADRDVAQAKAAKNNISLSASYGFNRASTTLGPIYNDPENQQTFSLGISVPILDWGRQKARYNTAVALKELVEFNNDIESSNIVQEITTVVNSIALLNNNINIARITDSVAERRFIIANRLFQLGKLSVSEINIAGSEKDQARRNYILALREFWNSFLLLRQHTMYDFVTHQELNHL